MNNTQESQTPDSSRKHKGGRPHIPEEQKRTVCKKAYFTIEEAKCVELAADENRMSDSEYMNQMTMNGYVKAPIDPEDFRAAANMAGNLNQLAYQANKAGFSSVAKELLDLRSRLHGVLDIIYSWI